MFITKFENADKDGNLHLDVDEVKEYFFLFRSLKDITGMREILKDENIWPLIVNDMSRGHVKKGHVDFLNFYEWLFLRTVCISWTIGSGSLDSITRNELLDIALKVMPQ